jgi:hypothetical protein
VQARRTITIFAIGLLCAGCHQPTAPSCARHAAINSLDGFSLRCLPDGDTLRCRADAQIYCDIADVTMQVESWASSNPQIVTVAHGDGGVGLARSVAVGDATITAVANGVTSFPARVRVIAGAPPLRIADVYGQVRLGPSCGQNDGLTGVQVTAIDGVLTGLTSITGANGVYGWQNIVSPPSVTFRATKEGYRDVVAAGGPQGFPTLCMSPNTSH